MPLVAPGFIPADALTLRLESLGALAAIKRHHRGTLRAIGIGSRNRDRGSQARTAGLVRRGLDRVKTVGMLLPMP
jgi:hypothetical protein